MFGKIVLIPLETTHTAIATKSVLAGFQKEESKFRQMMYELVSHFARGYVEIYGFTAPLYTIRSLFSTSCFLRSSPLNPYMSLWY